MNGTAYNNKRNMMLTYEQLDRELKLANDNENINIKRTAEADVFKKPDVNLIDVLNKLPIVPGKQEQAAPVAPVAAPISAPVSGEGIGGCMCVEEPTPIIIKGNGLIEVEQDKTEVMKDIIKNKSKDILKKIQSKIGKK